MSGGAGGLVLVEGLADGAWLGRRVWPFGLVAALFAVVAGVRAAGVGVPEWLRPATHETGGTRVHAALVAILLLVLVKGIVGRRRVAYWVGVTSTIVGALVLGPGVPAVFLVVTAVLLALRMGEFP